MEAFDFEPYGYAGMACIGQGECARLRVARASRVGRFRAVKVVFGAFESVSEGILAAL